MESSTSSSQTTVQPARQPNRLIHERSPYLLQHAHNPVAWYPWGEEAFTTAAREGKPIFLSIGYSTCHWCHVMERESFEDPAIAELLNRHFISIKVDREELPDVDDLYMQAVMAMTGHGGWPLTVFLTPERQPFYGGTYFPPERRGALPGMTELLLSVADAWATRREELARSAQQLTRSIADSAAAAAGQGTITEQVLHDAFNAATSAFDPTYGGFGPAPKFPRAHELSFLLHYGARTGAGQALDLVTTTLDHLMRGGIHDQLGGGFHRYATDARWLVPHFEKMLYDQALLARAYLDAYRAIPPPVDAAGGGGAQGARPTGPVTGGGTEYAETARGIFEYVLRDLTDPRGAFYSAEDADSEGAEGTFYVWTPEQLTQALGAEDGALAAQFYGVRAEGNFEHGRSVLHVEQPLDAFATLKGFDRQELTRRLARVRARLLEVRTGRPRPHRDDKILTSWNGLMIASFAYGAATLQEPRYLEAAARAADFVLAHLVRDGQLLRRFRDGDARYPGTLEDYAFFGCGLLDLYEAGGDPRYLEAARRFAHALPERFGDAGAPGFFMRDQASDALIARAKPSYDGATPSGNSMAALWLLRLGHLTADRALEDLGRRTLEAFAANIERAPFGFPQLLIAWDFALGPVRELVIAGEPEDPRTQALWRVVHERFLPRTTLVHRPGGAAGDAMARVIPYVAAQTAVRGTPTAYVCEGYRCHLPTTDPSELATRLDRREE